MYMCRFGFLSTVVRRTWPWRTERYETGNLDVMICTEAHKLSYFDYVRA